MKRNILLSGFLLLMFSSTAFARPDADHVIVGKGYSHFHNIHRHYPSDHMSDVKLVKKYAKNEK